MLFGTIASSISSFNLTALKAYYKFNESSGNIINKASEVGSSSEISNSDLVVTGATYVPSGSSSPFGYAMSLDGTDDVLKASNSAIADWSFLNKDGAKWSICFWIFRDSNTSVDDLIATTNFNPNETGFLLRFNSSANTMRIFFGHHGVDRIDYTTTKTVSTGAWHFVFISYDDTTGELIVNVDNGTRESSTGHNLTNTNNPENFLHIGNDTNTGFFGGDICELSIWNRVLSSQEEADLYNNGNGREL